MKRQYKVVFSQILHPLLFGIYPILGLLAFNISELTFMAGYRALVFSLLGTLILMLVFWSIGGNWMRASLQTTIILVLFYSYGHVYLLLKAFEFGGVYLFRHRMMASLWVLIAIIGIWRASKMEFSLSNITYALNIAGLFLLVMPTYQIITQSLSREMEQDSLANDNRILSLQVPSNDLPPDIYYFILDGYGRADTLEDVYGYDNTEFIEGLRSLGFFVADCSQSNYAQTQFSLPSSLNMDYLPALGDEYLKVGKSNIGPLIKQNVVRKSLEALGYKTIAFETGYYWTQIQDADIYYSPENDHGILNGFESLLLESTMFRVVDDILSVEGDPLNKTDEKRQRTLFVLDKIEDVPIIRGPKFVFVHLIIPHPPYIFGSNGEDIDSELIGLTDFEKELLGYPYQVEYINMRMEVIISEIIGKSSVPPIIIIQGDHGPKVPDQSEAGDSHVRRMQILNAYYIPNTSVPLYSEITPVNTFRILFNYYFGQDLELRDDISYYSSYEGPAEFEIVENNCVQGR